MVAHSKYHTLGLGDTGKMLARYSLMKVSVSKLRISTKSVVISKSRQASPAAEHDASGHNRHYSYYPIIDTPQHSTPAIVN